MRFTALISPFLSSAAADGGCSQTPKLGLNFFCQFVCPFVLTIPLKVIFFATIPLENGVSPEGAPPPATVVKRVANRVPVAFGPS